MLCPKGHVLTPKTASVTEVPAFCNFCFKHVVQTCWSGDVKQCSVETCCFTVCASCLKSLSANSGNCSSIHSCEQQTVSSLKGVRMSWLHWFKKRWVNHYRDWTTQEAVDVLFRPRTFISRRIFCEDLALDGDMEHFVGPANRFVCHSWKSSFSELIDGLLDTVLEPEAILWIDVFSMQLHPIEASKRGEMFFSDDLRRVMSQMQSFSLSLLPLCEPATFESRWCLFETVLFLEAHPSAAIDVVLSPQEYLQFSNQLHVLSYATAIEQDIAKVQLSISKGTHFVRCVTEGFVPQGCSSSYFRSNEVIFNGIRAWLIKMMMFHFNKSIQKHDDFYTNALMIAFNKFFLNTDDNMSLLPFLAKYLQHKRAIFGEYHVETLVQMFENAKVMHKLQRYQEAVVLYHQCLRVKDIISGCEDTTVLSIKNELAVTLLKFFSIDAAHALLEVCVRSRRFLLGNDHIDTLNSEFHLSLVLCTKNQFEAALSLIESCLQRRTLILGLDHPVTLQTLSCKAQIAFKHMSNSKISAAQHSIKQKEINNLFTICLEKQEIILGKVHDDTILTRTNFALACSVFGDLRRARALFSESLDSIQLCSGPSHPTKFGMMRCSASVAMSAGETHVAERLYTDCLASLRTSFGKQHPTTLMTIEDLGHVYVSMQRFEDALSLFKECSDTWTQIGHPSRTFAIDLYQAATFRIQGNLLKAHSVAYESLLQCHRHFGPSHRATMELEVELGDILYAQSRWPQTKALLKKILEKKLSVDGPDNIHVIRLMAKLSNVYEKLQKYAKSRNLRIFVYNYFVEALGGYHPDTVDIMSKLARCMFLSNDLDNCEHMALAFLDRCHSLKLQNMEEQQQLRSIVDAVRRRRTRIGTFDKESGDDLLMAMELSLSMI